VTASDKTVSDYLLDSNLSADFDAQAGGRALQLDEVQWVAFIAALDMPPRDNPRLRQLLQTRGPWDSEQARPAFGFAAFPGAGDQIGAEAFVDQQPHDVKLAAGAAPWLLVAPRQLAFRGASG
jgi:uncharacterized protein DUF1778